MVTNQPDPDPVSRNLFYKEMGAASSIVDSLLYRYKFWCMLIQTLVPQNSFKNKTKANNNNNK